MTDRVVPSLDQSAKGATPHPVVAIDGTAASGKSTFARALAQRLGFFYVNTGAMYRGVTWFLLERAVPVEDTVAVDRALRENRVATSLLGGELHFRIGGIDPLHHVRGKRVNDAVSLVARLASVRALLVAQQQRLVESGPLVMEGRDIGTVVFPATPYKFYLDAAAEIRAQRRQAQGEADAIAQRDQIDRARATSPLTCAADALVLDSGETAVPVLLERALQHLAQRGLKLPPCV